MNRHRTRDNDWNGGLKMSAVVAVREKGVRRMYILYGERYRLHEFRSECNYRRKGLWRKLNHVDAE